MNRVRESVAAALSLERFQPLPRFDAPLAGGGGKQDPRLVTIFRHSPACAKQFGEIKLRSGISFFDGRP